jgi:hypothetical protein
LANYNHKDVYTEIGQELSLANLIEYYPGEHSFIGNIMYSTYWMVDWILRTERKNIKYTHELHEYDRINVNGLEWAKYHKKYQEKPFSEQINTSQKTKIRTEFCRLADIQAEETGIVMTIDEFEWAFIEHLRGLGVDI